MDELDSAASVSGLLLLCYGGGTASEVMKRIAAPMVGGMISAPLLSMLVVPVIFRLMRRSRFSEQARSMKVAPR